MNPVRIVLLSNARPWRAWRLANRLLREINGITIAGIVQKPLLLLPPVQRRIATGAVDDTLSSFTSVSWVEGYLHTIMIRVIARILRWAHGYPGRSINATHFTSEDLERECTREGWAFLQADCGDDSEVCNFVREHSADLVIALGDSETHLELRRITSCALIRAFQTKVSGNEQKSAHIVLDYVERHSAAVLPIASLKVPIQTYDTQLALTLKLDMMTDDLIAQSVLSLTSCEVSRALQKVDEWLRAIFTPYLSQLESVQQSPGQIDGRAFQLCRSRWKLCLHTLLLCSPFIAGRNWYRRWRNRYPVLIVAHHLISDRPHRLGLSTVMFWRLVRFLKVHYRIVSLSEAVRLLASGKVENPTVAFTFDDGYGENFVNLRAVAEEEGIPLALFVATNPIEHHREFEHDVRNKTSGAAKALPLTWDQIRYWASRETEFGSHTRTHFDCGSTDRVRLEEEIAGSKHDLESRVGKTAHFFAFPFGEQHNISSAAMELARAAYPYVASSFGGENLPNSTSDFQHLLRKNLYSHPWELELELQSVFDLTAHIRKKVRFGTARRARRLNEFTRSSALTLTART